MNWINVDKEIFDHLGKGKGYRASEIVITFAKHQVGGNFVWTPPNYNYPSAYLISSQVVIKQNIAVTKSYKLDNNVSIS